MNHIVILRLLCDNCLSLLRVHSIEEMSLSKIEMDIRKSVEDAGWAMNAQQNGVLCEYCKCKTPAKAGGQDKRI